MVISETNKKFIFIGILILIIILIIIMFIPNKEPKMAKKTYSINLNSDTAIFRINTNNLNIYKKDTSIYLKKLVDVNVLNTKNDSVLQLNNEILIANIRLISKIKEIKKRQIELQEQDIKKKQVKIKKIKINDEPIIDKKTDIVLIFDDEKDVNNQNIKTNIKNEENKTIKIIVYADGLQVVKNNDLMRLRIGENCLEHNLTIGMLFYCRVLFSNNRVTLKPILNLNNAIANNVKITDIDNEVGINISGLKIQKEVSNSIINAGTQLSAQALVGVAGQAVNSTVNAITNILKSTDKITINNNYKLYLNL